MAYALHFFLANQTDPTKEARELSQEKQPHRRFDQAAKSSARTRRWRTQCILDKSPSQLGLDLGLREAEEGLPGGDAVDHDSQP